MDVEGEGKEVGYEEVQFRGKCRKVCNSSLRVILGPIAIHFHVSQVIPAVLMEVEYDVGDESGLERSRGRYLGRFYWFIIIAPPPAPHYGCL